MINFSNPTKKLWLYLPLFLLPLLTGNALAGETTRVSVSSSGEQADCIDPFCYGYTLSLSANGRFAAFASSANHLVAADVNYIHSIFVHDQRTGETTRASVSSSGEPANDRSYQASLSADGRIVAFQSYASNLVADDTNYNGDIFVHDRLTGETTRVSVATSGEQANSWSASPGLSADGRYVAFVSDADNLIAGDTNANSDIFVHDRITDKTTRVSVSSSGEQANNLSGGLLSLSADGRYVAFTSFASNLVAGDTNEALDIFVHDRKTSKTERVSVSSGGKPANDESDFSSLSADGRYVAFASWASNLVKGDTNDVQDVFVHDRKTGKTTRVSVASGIKQANSWSASPGLSADGRFVAFMSSASNLVADDTNNQWDVFVHDRKTGKTRRASVSSSGEQANNWSGGLLSLSADGRYVAFMSSASNLVAGDSNSAPDIFVRDRNLNTLHQADLDIAVTDQPGSLPANGQGAFRYQITNHGPEPVGSTRLLHSVSNGKVVSFKPSQGQCKRYATLSLCDFGTLQPNASMTLDVQVKASRYPLSQLLSASPLAKQDPAPNNNSVTVNTQVTPTL